MARFGLLIDVSKCNGCYNCFLACRDEFYGNDYGTYSAAQPAHGQFWLQIKEVERGSYPRPKLDYISIPCQHCKDAACIKRSTDGAVYRRKDGIVIIDPQKAKGQKDIVFSCPYRLIYWNEELEVPQKCTMCAHRLDEGVKEPRCAEACPTGALLFGDLDDPNSEISKASAKLPTEELCPEYGTHPLVKYVGLPKRFITGEVVRKDIPGECLEGAKVTLESEAGSQKTTTDSYGEFEFNGLCKNTAYRIRIEQVGYVPLVFEVVTHKDVDLGEVILEPVS